MTPDNLFSNIPDSITEGNLWDPDKDRPF